MKTVINEVVVNFIGRGDQSISLRTDIKLSVNDISTIVSDIEQQNLEEIVYRSLISDEKFLRAKAKQIASYLKGDTDFWEVKKIEYWDEENNRL